MAGPDEIKTLKRLLLEVKAENVALKCMIPVMLSMGLKTEVRLTFAGARRSFDLAPIGCLRRLQLACDAGPQWILNRLLDGSWRLDDLRETLLQSLVGGGTAQNDAVDIIEAHFDPDPNNAIGYVSRRKKKGGEPAPVALTTRRPGP